MTKLTFRWVESKGLHPQVSFAPVRIIGHNLDVLVTPGEEIEVPKDAYIVAEIPGFQRYEKEIVAEGPSATLWLEVDDLIPLDEFDDRHEPEECSARPTKVAVSVKPWTAGRQSNPHTAPHIWLTTNQEDYGFTVNSKGGAAIPLAVEVASRLTPHRLLAVPRIAGEGRCQITWYRPWASALRPRVQPDDPAGQLLMEYLTAGRFLEATAAARIIEFSRGELHILDWSAASYTQILIGYSHALGRDHARLSAWCRRTAAASLFGADGLVLTAESAWQENCSQAAYDHMLKAAKLAPPTVTLGVEMQLRLATLLLARLPSKEGKGVMESEKSKLVHIQSSCLHLLARADADTATVSLPQTGITTPDLSDAPAWRRVAAWARFVVTRWGYDHILRPMRAQEIYHPLNLKKGMRQMSTTSTNNEPDEAVTIKPLAGPALWVALFAIAAWVGFSIYLLTQAGSTQEISWTRIIWVFASVEAIAFAAAGALFGTAVQRGHVMQAEQRAESAENTARQHQEEATAGRALAASMQADDIAAGAGENRLKSMGTGGQVSEDVRRRHAQLARSLFGDLVKP
ncbi:hypothetical protein [Streptomyces sp. NPDC023588]|uniref:hypothetical protein n=1 Tax=Streptomyces sp. NPDC023588 TaxID=3154907 RepID=UPI0033D77272